MCIISTYYAICTLRANPSSAMRTFALCFNKSQSVGFQIVNYCLRIFTTKATHVSSRINSNNLKLSKLQTKDIAQTNSALVKSKSILSLQKMCSIVFLIAYFTLVIFHLHFIWLVFQFPISAFKRL